VILAVNVTTSHVDAVLAYIVSHEVAPSHKSFAARVARVSADVVVVVVVVCVRCVCGGGGGGIQYIT
jgi:hypothetical protein